MRARTVEPVFGQLKTCQNFAMMSRRGFTACESEWLPASTAHNLRKLHRHRTAGQLPEPVRTTQDLKIAQGRSHARRNRLGQDPDLPQRGFARQAEKYGLGCLPHCRRPRQLRGSALDNRAPSRRYGCRGIGLCRSRWACRTG
jgi:hypothetical protein